ncbi:glyoxylase-like metal-dependent hydrolase (beta-lactamase superfamily II) [Pedobacter cryoconitis]|uniref:Glyoxylase-like metal-dependent hydrolase (Beta-lactamase superfamily II) n=1 Tax=Pedobacter cryoconitis TaxID=188932 RepID=A0A7W9DYU0_9SPHI|nr:MBL fold metallo-hydrolase [Pedobacter cryoconitis]MBB5636368.1 glyoxylase-like metal-dependent hydrolase (beta-lactamase superfamily II) [Pedobacter cryoconitis]
MQVFTLYEGSYSVAADKKFVPFNPQTDNPKDRPGSLFINVNPFLVKLGDKLLVLDTGLGYSNNGGQLILHENIRKAGFDPDDVDYVLMSHLHFDHAGGMVHKENNGMELSFPNATYVIQRGEWEGAFTNPSSSYRTEIFDFLQRNATLQFVDETGDFMPGIRHILTGGHTPFHQAWLLDDGEDMVFFGGDVLPEPEELLKKFIAKYDYDGRKSMELREEFGHKAVKEHWNCLFYHGKSKATGFIEPGDEGQFKIV